MSRRNYHAHVDATEHLIRRHVAISSGAIYLTGASLEAPARLVRRRAKGLGGRSALASSMSNRSSSATTDIRDDERFTYGLSEVRPNDVACCMGWTGCAHARPTPACAVVQLWTRDADTFRSRPLKGRRRLCK